MEGSERLYDREYFFKNIGVVKRNCWEFIRCGREPGGDKADELGVCLAAQEDKLDGVHGGRNAGRACWVLRGTLCGGRLQDSISLKLVDCVACDFYRSVRSEEGDSISSTIEVIRMLNPAI